MPQIRNFIDEIQAFIDNGYPGVGNAISNAVAELSFLETGIEHFEPQEWVRRMNTIVAVAMPYQNTLDTQLALGFKLVTESPIDAAMKRFKRAAEEIDPFYKELLQLASSVEEQIRSDAALSPKGERVLLMRENIRAAIPLQHNQEVARWLERSISTHPRVITTWDGKVLYNPDQARATRLRKCIKLAISPILFVRRLVPKAPQR